MASSAYATMADWGLYMPQLNTPPNTQLGAFLLSAVSRWVDNQMGQYFYSDGVDTKYFDGEGDGSIDTGQHAFYAKVGTVATCVQGATSLTFTSKRGPIPNNGDVLTLDILATNQEQVTVNGAPTASGSNWTLPLATGTRFAHTGPCAATTFALQLAYFENQPLSQWTTIMAGDGITPPTNYWFMPRNPRNADSSADPTQRRPWWGLDIAHIPISGTTYLPSGIPGYGTIAITANWGWPVVPDPIKDFTLRWAIKMWRSKESGWAESIGSAETGLVHEFLKLNAMDEATVLAHDYKAVYL